MVKRIRQDYSDKTEMVRARQVAEEFLGLEFDEILRSGSEANMIGIQSERVLFSQRLDSRTYFVQDNAYGLDKEAGVFRGTDEELFSMSHSIMERLHIPLSEIAEQTVLREQIQAAEVIQKTGEVHLEEVQEGKNYVSITRQIKKIPVWTSNMLVGFTQDKRIGFLQLHWPEIPKLIILEARRMAYMVSQQWSVPELRGAAVEAVEAGIIHSPAASLLMDIYPVVRVIYAPSEEGLGKKPVHYLDRHGQPVPFPRQAILPIKERLQRPAK